MTNPATDTQLYVLGAIVDYIEDHGYPPTIRELCEITGTSSSSTIHLHLRALQRKGYLEIKAESPRALRVLDGGKS